MAPFFMSEVFMPNFTLHRNFVLRSKFGHAINFRKGKPAWVPPVCVAEAVAIGAQPVDEDVDVIGDEPKVVHLAPHEREEKIMEVILKLVARNERGDFTAAGLPDLRKMNGMLDFEATKPERDMVWQRYQAEQADAMQQDKMAAEEADD